MQPVVDICLFTYRTYSANAFLALQAMIAHTVSSGIEVKLWPYGNALIDTARNSALAKVRPEATHVLLMDDDMLPAPDALLRLLQVDAPVVSALCTTRVPPVQYAAKVYDPDRDVFGSLHKIRRDRPVLGHFAVGGAFLLIQRAVIDRVVEYYLSARDWLDEHKRLFDRLHVRAEKRETERQRREANRRERFEREKYIRVFDRPVQDDDTHLGEDISFGRKLLNLNIPVVLDGTTTVGHLGEYPFTPADVRNDD